MMRVSPSELTREGLNRRDELRQGLLEGLAFFVERSFVIAAFDWRCHFCSPDAKP